MGFVLFKKKASEAEAKRIDLLCEGLEDIELKELISSESLSDLKISKKIKRSRRKQILSILKKKAEQSDDHLQFVSLMDNLNKKRSSSETYLFLQKHLKESEKVKSSFIKALYRLVIAVKSDNKVWVRNEIDQLASFGGEVFLFQEININLKDKIKGAFEYVYEQLGGRTDIRFLINHLYLVTDFKFFNELVQELSTSFTLNEIREISRHQQIGETFLLTVFEEYRARSSIREAFEKLRKSFTVRRISKLNLDSLWIFSKFVPNGDNRREALKKKLKELLNSKKEEHRFIILSLLKNPTMKKMIESIDKKMKKPLFIHQRRFFQGLLKRRVATIFATYQLYQLGDENNDFLWWNI